MSSAQALTPTEQRTVMFYDDELTAVSVEENGRSVVYVPVRPLCTFLGVSWQGQHRRINDDEVLSEVVMSINITLTDIDPSSRRPKTSQMLCIPLDYVNGFLFGISPKRAKPEVKEQLIRYQRECYRVLADAFLLPTTTAVSSNATLIQVREMGLAIARLAEEQMQMEQRLNTRIDKAAVVVGNLNKRVTSIEQRLGTGQPVSQEQASELSQAVKALAFKLGEQSGRVEFGRVYGELYRQFGITSYKLMPANRLGDALAFLREWYQSVADNEVPF
ncbi:MAG: phage antirepressor N-terminal domain-containing protein [Chloroflexota bacterium]